MTKGLLVSIYCDGSNCGRSSFAAHYNQAILTGPGVPEIFEPNDDAPEIELLPANIGDGFKIVPKVRGKGAGPMFGGCFIYTSDSRFPSKQPGALHDRWES